MEKEISYWDHLEELRRRILFYLLIFFILSIISYIYINKIISFFEIPIKKYNLNLFYFSPFEKFFLNIKISFFCGLIVSFPILFYQIIVFVLPALNENEKKYFLIISILSIIILIFSLLFSMFVIIPFSLNFFINISKLEYSKIITNASSYFNFIFIILFSTILIFQVPIILIILIKIKILNLEIISRNRKYVILIILIFSALLSPPDVLSMLILSIPLYFLFELSIFMGKIFTKNKLEK